MVAGYPRTTLDTCRKESAHFTMADNTFCRAYWKTEYPRSHIVQAGIEISVRQISSWTWTSQVRSIIDLTNGMVERMHATMGHAITTLTQGRPDRWDEYLQQTVFALRVRKHAVTKQSPFYLLYGVHPRLPGDDGPIKKPWHH
ncbi:hypothetical protein BASA81_010350 [Batrachochytrium salamandrivorans]|nr:hypothetical protein BASA81_010350 [Batrachochytrium salamandrivorans]